MTDAHRLPAPDAAIGALPRGSAVILRHYGCEDRAALGRRLRELTRGSGIALLVAGDPRLAVALGADGLHLRESDLGRPGLRGCRHRRWLVTAAAHSASAVRRAVRCGVDAILLSAVFPTGSHPGGPVLGVTRFARIVRVSPVPVYALGGVTPATVRRLKASGAAGVAGIGGIAALAACRRRLIMRHSPMPG